MSDVDDFTRLDDSSAAGAGGQRCAPNWNGDRQDPAAVAALAVLYNESTEEVNARAAKAWARAGRTSR